MQRLFITVLACLITTSSIGQSSNNSNLTSDDYFNRGLGHLDIGNNEDAIADFTNAIRIEPDYTEAYYKRGNGYLYLENYEDAIADYTRAIRIDPDYTEAYNNRGIAKYFAGFDGCSDLMKAEELGHAHPDALKAICE